MLHSAKRRWAAPAVAVAMLLTPAAAAVAQDVTGTPGSDHLRGTRDADTIHALAGNDGVRTFAGSDTVDAGPGRDRVLAGAGNDSVDGGAGSDRVRADYADVVSASCERVVRAAPRPRDSAPEDNAPGAH